jgi:hypothetical protein
MLLLAVCSERRVVELPSFAAFWDAMSGSSASSSSTRHGGATGISTRSENGAGGDGGATRRPGEERQSPVVSDVGSGGPGNSSELTTWTDLRLAALERACAWTLERVDHTLVFVVGSPTWFVLPPTCLTLVQQPLALHPLVQQPLALHPLVHEPLTFHPLVQHPHSVASIQLQPRPIVADKRRCTWHSGLNKHVIKTLHPFQQLCFDHVVHRLVSVSRGLACSCMTLSCSTEL